MFKIVVAVMLTSGLIMAVAISNVKNVNIDNLNIIKL